MGAILGQLMIDGGPFKKDELYTTLSSLEKRLGWLFCAWEQFLIVTKYMLLTCYLFCR